MVAPDPRHAVSGRSGVRLLTGLASVAQGPAELAVPVAPCSFHERSLFTVGRCGVSSGDSGPPTPDNPYGAAPSSHDGSRSVDFAGSAGQRAAYSGLNPRIPS